MISPEQLAYEKANQDWWDHFDHCSYCSDDSHDDSCEIGERLGQLVADLEPED